MTVYIKEEITFHLAFFLPSPFLTRVLKGSNPTGKGQKMSLTMHLKRITHRTFLHPPGCQEKQGKR